VLCHIPAAAASNHPGRPWVSLNQMNSQPGR
jgi:hypothetical protein